jgi:hypothetical protein
VRPLTGCGSKLALIATASRRSKAKMSLPVVRFPADDDEEDALSGAE